jgi:hypothetical protein
MSGLEVGNGWNKRRARLETVQEDEGLAEQLEVSDESSLHVRPEQDQQPAKRARLAADDSNNDEREKAQQQHHQQGADFHHLSSICDTRCNDARVSSWPRTYPSPRLMMARTRYNSVSTAPRIERDPPSLPRPQKL